MLNFKNIKRKEDSPVLLLIITYTFFHHFISHTSTLSSPTPKFILIHFLLPNLNSFISYSNSSSCSSPTPIPILPLFHILLPFLSPPSIFQPQPSHPYWSPNSWRVQTSAPALSVRPCTLARLLLARRGLSRPWCLGSLALSSRS